MSRYQGVKAVVTGGTHGMGPGVASALLAGGPEVVVTGRDEAKPASALRALPGARLVRSDASRLADVDSLRDTVERVLGHVDFLFAPSRPAPDSA